MGSATPPADRENPAAVGTGEALEDHDEHEHRSRWAARRGARGRRPGR